MSACPCYFRKKIYVPSSQKNTPPSFTIHMEGGKEEDREKREEIERQRERDKARSQGKMISYAILVFMFEVELSRIFLNTHLL